MKTLKNIDTYVLDCKSSVMWVINFHFEVPILDVSHLQNHVGLRKCINLHIAFFRIRMMFFLLRKVEKLKGFLVRFEGLIYNLGSLTSYVYPPNISSHTSP